MFRQPFHEIEPSVAAFLRLAARAPEKRFGDRPDAAQRERAALEAFDAETAESGAVEKCRHSHRHDHACGFAFEQLLRKTVLSAIIHRKAGPERLLDECLEKRGHRAVPKRKEEHEVIGPGDVFLRLAQRFGRRRAVEVFGYAQHRHVRVREIYAAHLTACRACCPDVTVGERVNQARFGRIRMSVHNGNVSHARRVGRSREALWNVMGGTRECRFESGQPCA